VLANAWDKHVAQPWAVDPARFDFLPVILHRAGKARINQIAGIVVLR
jgi:hypothetical protein